MKNLKGLRFSNGKFPKGSADELVVLSQQLQWIAFCGMTFEDREDESKLKDGLKCEQRWNEITVGCWFYNVNSSLLAITPFANAIYVYR
jgi:hypothetical protein